MTKHIPNLLTLLNLASGTIGIYMILSGEYSLALIFFALSIGMDFADGFAARLLQAGSEIGKQLDSMADLVSFGLFSMAMVFSVFQLIIPGSEGSWFSDLSFLQKIKIISLLIIPLLSALRLARFNLQEQSDYFVGLPVPAFALFWAGIYYDMHVNQSFFGQDLNPWFLWAIVMVMSLMMVVPLPMLSLKFTSLSFRKNFASYILLIAALIILAFTGIAGLPLVILTYILLSLLRIVLT